MSVEGFRPHVPFLALVVAVGLWAGCSGGSGSSQTGSGSDFTFLNVDLFSVSGSTPVSVVNSNLDFSNASTSVCVTLSNNLKNPSVTTPSPLDNVNITSYTVTITRLDGGRSPGPFTFNTAFTVPAGTISGTPAVPTGNTARIPVVLVPVQTKREPPLSNPRPNLPLSATANVIFRGRNGRGTSTSAEGTISLNFVADGSVSDVASC